MNKENNVFKNRGNLKLFFISIHRELSNLYNGSLNNNDKI